MSKIDEENEQIVRKALYDLRNLNIQSDLPVVGKDLREIILKQMELSCALLERQHQDIDKMHASVKQFTASSKRVEKLTLALIGLTGILAVMTYILIPTSSLDIGSNEY